MYNYLVNSTMYDYLFDSTMYNYLVNSTIMYNISTCITITISFNSTVEVPLDVYFYKRATLRLANREAENGRNGLLLLVHYIYIYTYTY